MITIVFWGVGWGPISRVSVDTQIRSHPPHPLPAEHCKGQSRKGVGDIARPATVLSHTVRPLCLNFPPWRRGKCCPFFSFCVFLCLVRCLLPLFAVRLVLGSLFEKFSGANFCFWVAVWVLCFVVGFCLCFCFSFWLFAPETVWKNSIDVRSVFFWVSFSLP